MTPILVIEDDQNTLAGLKELLEAEGYDVETAASVEDGNSLLANKDFPVVLVDYKLGDGNGLDIISGYSRQQTNPTWFLMSAYLNPDVERAALKAGVARIFNKPLSLDRLFEAIADVPQASPDHKRGNSDAAAA